MLIKILNVKLYYELTKLEDVIPSIKNIHVSAREENGNITFLHKIKDGAVDKSYGIHVAKLAGMPEELTNRAQEILTYYEKHKKEEEPTKIQLEMNFDEPPKENQIEKYLKEIDPLNLTPIEAINKLYELKELVK